MQLLLDSTLTLKGNCARIFENTNGKSSNFLPVFNAVNKVLQSRLARKALADADLECAHGGFLRFGCFARFIPTAPGILIRVLRGRRAKKI